MVTEADLDGVNRQQVYSDGTVVRVFCMQTDDAAYSSGWAYRFHYGATDSDAPGTLDDGTIRRYDNSHEDTKSHELHVAPDPDPERIEFPGVVALWDRFWSEIPKDEFSV